MQFETEVMMAGSDSAGFTHLKLRRPAGYDYLPGQYVTLSYGSDDKPRFLALASHASEQELLLLSRQDNSASGRVNISAPQGKGFGCDYSQTGSFLFVTHGTGISALRPAVIERAIQSAVGDTMLYGAANAAAAPAIDCLTETEALRQIRAYSKNTPSQHVQDILQSLDLSKFAAILMIGSKEMMQSCRDIFARQGFDPSRVFTNY